MKRMVSFSAVVVALGCVCVLAAAQGVMHKGSLQAPSPPWLGIIQSNVVVSPSSAGNLLLPTLALAPTRAFRIQTLPLFARVHPRAVSPTPPAGVYKTSPYSCIVVVPGPHPDDRCVVKPSGVESAMPIIRPDLRFIPWNPAKQ